MRLGSIVHVKDCGKSGKVKAICHDQRTGVWEFLVDFDYQKKDAGIHAGVWFNKMNLKEIGHESF